MELIKPYGGKLVDLAAPREGAQEIVERANELPSIQLSARTLFDLELMATGGLSPLNTFMDRDDYRSVLETQRLANGLIFPVPITLGVDDLSGINGSEQIALRSETNNLVACMHVEQVYERDLAEEAQQVCGTASERHPLAAEIRSWGRYCLTGRLTVIELPRHYDFPELRRTPDRVRARLAEMDRSNVVAFHPQRPMYRPDEELTKCAAADMQASLLILPWVGLDPVGSIDHYTRIRGYRALVQDYYAPDTTLVNLIPRAHFTECTRERLLQAIIDRNYGANFSVIDQRQATHQDAAFIRMSEEIGVLPLSYEETRPAGEDSGYEQVRSSGSERRARVFPGGDNEDSLSAQNGASAECSVRPEVAQILREAYPPQHKQGFCLWFTGYPSSGKSTISNILTVLLMEHGRQVTVLDGDVVRTHLSKGLGFSREDRDVNICRIGYVASEIVRHHGAVICAAVSPYRAARNRVRSMMAEGTFIEIFVDTPLAICEERDVKGYYARARAGGLKGFTGVDDPYEPPWAPEIHLRTANERPEESAREIISYLCNCNLLLGSSRRGASRVGNAGISTSQQAFAGGDSMGVSAPRVQAAVSNGTTF